MTTTQAPLVAVICEDDAVVATALVDTLSGLFGFAVAAVVGTADEAIAAADDLAPELVVIDLALAGYRGLGIIAALAKVSPDTVVVAVVPAHFGALRAEAGSAGAQLVELGDLRPLRSCLERLHAAAHGARCPSCPATRSPGTAAASDPNKLRVSIEVGPASPAVFQLPTNGSSSSSQKL